MIISHVTSIRATRNGFEAVAGSHERNLSQRLQSSGHKFPRLAMPLSGIEFLTGRRSSPTSSSPQRLRPWPHQSDVALHGGQEQRPTRKDVVTFVVAPIEQNPRRLTRLHQYIARVPCCWCVRGGQIAARGARDSPRRAAQGDCRAEFPVDFTAGLPVDRLRALAGVTQQANKDVRVADPSVQPNGAPKEQMWNDAGIVLSQYVDSTKGLSE